MRPGPALALLGALLAAPLAAAQAPLALDVAPLPGDEHPVGEALRTRLRVAVACEVLAGRNATLVVDLAADRGPGWVRAAVVPSRLYLDPLPACDGAAPVAREAELQATLEPPAPASVEATFHVTARAEDLLAIAAVRVRPAFFSLLEASTPTTVLRAAPGQRLDVDLAVTNFGNTAVRVAFTLEQGPGGLQVVVPPPLALAAAPGATGRAVLGLVAPSGPFVNEVGSVALRLDAEHVERPGLRGDSAVVSLVVTTKGFPAPAPAAGALLLAAALAALAARRARGYGARGP